MSPDRYKRAGSIFEQALEIEPDQLDSFLTAACGQDAELRAQVEEMLRAEREIPQDFLAKPAMHAAAQMLAQQNQGEGLTAISGTIFGNYRAGKKIGAGGMGSVYEAVDLRLDRMVALKVLPPLFVTDADRVRRFEQEARAASLLNHPNIVSIYDADLDEATGLHYIAIELVLGKTLREIAQAHPIETKELLDIAMQIASALRAAHQAGILHRDIKPENVMVRPDGIVKVLDFGLAKLLDASASDPARAPVSQTRHGNVAGTVHYLSPEQVLGKTATPRSDLFSLGIVLYELATGERPFQGPTDGAVFEAILHSAPTRPREVRASLPQALEAVILRLLEKDPDLRFQSADDLRSALKLLDRDSHSSLPSSPVSARVPQPQQAERRGWMMPAAVATVATAALSLIPWWWISRHELQPQPVFYERLTMDPGEPEYPSLSPDGKQFVYASRESGNWDIYLRRTGGITAINLTKDHAGTDTQPAFSHDGTRVAFRSERDGGGIFVMEVTGENPRRISSRGYQPSWSPDDREIVCGTGDNDNPSRFGGASGPLIVIHVATGRERLLTRVTNGRQPVWSPNGNLIAFWTIPEVGSQRDIFTVRADNSADPVHVTHDEALDWSPVWLPKSDELMFLSDRSGPMNVWKVAVDAKTGASRGLPVPVTVPAAYVRHLTSSSDGSRFAFVRSEQSMRLYTAPLDKPNRRLASVPVQVGDRTNWVASFGISPDGSRIAFDTLGDSQEDLWVMNADGSHPRRLTNDLAKDREPTWSPDGKELAFYSDRANGVYDVWAIRADGSGLRQVSAVSRSGRFVQTPAWSHDGRSLFAWASGGPPVILPAHAPSPAKEAPTIPGLDKLGDGVLFSPWTRPAKPAPGDRSDLWLVTAGKRIFTYDFTTGTTEETGAQGDYPNWLPGQKQFVFKRDSGIYFYNLASRTERLLTDVFPARLWILSASPDGTRVYFSASRRENDIWLARFTQ